MIERDVPFDYENADASRCDGFAQYRAAMRTGMEQWLACWFYSTLTFSDLLRPWTGLVQPADTTWGRKPAAPIAPVPRLV